MYGTSTVVSTALRMNRSTFGERQTSILLNSAAQIRGRALASGTVVGVDDIEGFDWHRLLLRTGMQLYLYDCAYWRVTKEPARRGDQPPTLTIELYLPGRIRRQRDGTFMAPGGERVDPEEIVAIDAYQTPSDAKERLKMALEIETSLLKEWAAQTLAVISPRFLFKSPDQDIPATTEQATAHKNRVQEMMQSAVITLYNEQDLLPISPQPDPESHVRIEEVRRLVAMDSGIPPQLLGTRLDSSHRNFETLMRHFYEDTVMHESRRVVSAVRAQGAMPDFNITMDGHYALAQTRAENASVLQMRALSYRHLTQGGMDAAQAAEFTGFVDADAA